MTQLSIRYCHDDMFPPEHFGDAGMRGPSLAPDDCGPGSFVEKKSSHGAQIVQQPAADFYMLLQLFQIVRHQPQRIQMAPRLALHRRLDVGNRILPGFVNGLG
jgi:hypothetical protein